MDLLTILYLLLLIVFPLGEVIRIPVFQSSYIYPVDVVIGAIFCWSVYNYIRFNNAFSHPLLKPFLIFVGFAALSLVLNLSWLKPAQFFVSFLYLVRFVVYANLLFAAKFLPQSFRKRLPVYVAVSGLTIVAFGFVQYFYYPSLKNLYYLGWDDHLYRMFSTFLDPNFAGAFFVLVAILIIGLFWVSFHLSNPPAKPADRQGGTLRKAQLIIFALGVLLTFIAVFLSYSRTAFIMLATGVIGYSIFIGKKKIIFGLAVLVLLALIIVPKNFKIEGMNPFRTVSTAARADQFQNSLKIFSESPVYGIGFNAYRYAQIKHRFIVTDVDTTHGGAGVANSFLFLLATTGIIGLGLYLYFWWNVIMFLSKKKKKFLNSAMITSLIALFIGSLFENLLFYPSIMIWTFLLLGLTVDSGL
jgi:O-antigen ligase